MRSCDWETLRFGKYTIAAVSLTLFTSIRSSFKFSTATANHPPVPTSAGKTQSWCLPVISFGSSWPSIDMLILRYHTCTTATSWNTKTTG